MRRKRGRERIPSLQAADKVKVSSFLLCQMSLLRHKAGDFPVHRPTPCRNSRVLHNLTGLHRQLMLPPAA